MAGWVSSYTYNGIKYNRGDALVLNGSYYYDITDQTPNGTLNNETKYFYGVYVFDDGSLPLNPVGISNAQAASSPSGGTIRFEAISSGGSPIFTVGQASVEPYDDRNGAFPNTGGWFESAVIKWSGFSAPPENPIVNYHIYYRECADNGNKPNGKWSTWLGVTGDAGTGGTKYIGYINQNSPDSNWGNRNQWYQFVVIGILKDGSNTGWDCTTGYVRKSLSYTQTFNANGGSGAPSTLYKFTGYDFIFPSTVPKRTGHTFVGWSTSPGASGGYGAGARVASSAIGDAEHVWYAIWRANPYVLTVNPNGGTWNGSTSVQTFTQNYGTTKTISNPTRVGYTFAGWTLSGSGSLSGTTYTYGAGNGTVTAKWTRIVLTVTFDATTNGGTPNSTRDVYYGDTVGALPTPKKTYYKFVGWFTKASGGTQISASQVITSNITYYAQFKIDASVKVGQNGEKTPAIVWVGQNGVWSKVVAWIGEKGIWNKSTGAD